MACSNCFDGAESIGSCKPYANRDDVLDLFRLLDDSCCLITYDDATIDPTVSDDQVAAMMALGAPDGIDTCPCACVYSYNSANGSIYINCSGNLGLADNWCSICGGSSGDCFSHLTTVDLSPDLDEPSRLAAIAEAYPNGYPESCEEAVMILEDGSRCWTVDYGATWTCAGAAVAGAAFTARTAANDRVRPCPTGCNNVVGNDCDGALFNGGRSHPLRLFTVSHDDDAANGTLNFAGSPDVFSNCVVCNYAAIPIFSAAGQAQSAANPERFGFLATADGDYRFEITFSYTGNYSIGNVGCPGCALTGTTDGRVQLYDSAGNIVFQWNLTGRRGQTTKITNFFAFNNIVPLTANTEYMMILQIDAIPVACCNCNPAFDVRGQGGVQNWGVEFLG